MEFWLIEMGLLCLDSGAGAAGGSSAGAGEGGAGAAAAGGDAGIQWTPEETAYLTKQGTDPTKIDAATAKIVKDLFADRGSQISKLRDVDKAGKDYKAKAEAYEKKEAQMKKEALLEGELTPEKLRAVLDQADNAGRRAESYKQRLELFSGAGIIAPEIVELLESSEQDPFVLALKIGDLKAKLTPAADPTLGELAAKTGALGATRPGPTQGKSDPAEETKNRLDQIRGTNTPEAKRVQSWLDASKPKE